MNFSFGPGEEAFRGEVRAFLSRELPADWWGVASEEQDDETWAFSRALSRKVGDKGWLSLCWPKQYGGMDGTFGQQLVFCEEVAYHRAPIRTAMVASDLIGSTLIVWGTDAQKGDYLLKIARGEITFAVLYSEPDTGSDAASMRLSAQSQGNSFVIDGTKIYSTNAHRADYFWVAARTNLGVPKHKGLSLLLIPSHFPGITVSPILNMLGVHSFNEVQFDSVVVSRSWLVGEENKAWSQAIRTQLQFERKGITLSSAMVAASCRRSLEELIRYVREKSCTGTQLGANTSLSKRKLAEMAIEIEVAKLIGYRVAWFAGKGEVPAREAALAKVWGSTLLQRFANTGMEILGMYGMLTFPCVWARQDGRFAREYLHSVAATIAGGTSEIQRDIIASNGLGLPRP